MKTAEPKIIYLQIGEDADITEFEEGDFWTNAITWCWERIFKNDIEYINKSNLLSLIDEMIKEETDRANISQLYSNRHDHKKEALTELKEKLK